MKRRDYLTELMRQRPEWLRGSMAEPTHYMTRTHVLLHAVALRRMRALGPNDQHKGPPQAVPLDAPVRRATGA